MKYSINLASRSYVNKRALYIGYLVCGVVLVAGLFYTLAYYFDLQSQISTTEARLGELKDKILASQGGDAADYNAARYDKVLVQIHLANGILSRDSFRWTKLLDQLEQVVPGNVRIKSISPDHEENTVELTGVAKGLTDLKKLLDNLIMSGLYEEVLLFDQATDKSGEIGFSIELLGAF